MKQRLLKYLTKYTTLGETEQQAILEEIQVEAFPIGTTLLRQGEVPAACYFVLEGCIRQFSVDERGNEHTSNFYTEEQAAAILHDRDQPSKYTWVCTEDSVLVVGDLAIEQDMYNKHAQLESLTRMMMEQSFGQIQDEFAAFMAATPEERLKSLLRNRPGLINRVPQHQLASYLGMTPESLSRIKKRIQSSR